jgi:two-component system sensor histidine kinase DctS
MQPFKLEYRLRRHDGIYRWMLDSGVPRFTEEGDFSGYIGTCVDITEQKQFETIREKMEHVGRLNIAGEMASSMAHELSQPLTACNNYLDGCLRRMEESDWNRENLHKAVQLAHKQAERAGKIINHLKEMVRKQGHERVLIDVNQLARDVVTFLEDEIKRQGISVHMVLFPMPKVMACKVEIEQVLLNLCKNAIESMRSRPQRELRLSTGVVESGEILVTVSDSGSGIPAGAMESLFNPFQSSKQDGLGLGLAICRSFIENHGGRIWVDTQRESGAEFYFTLPIGAEHE